MAVTFTWSDAEAVTAGGAGGAGEVSRNLVTLAKSALGYLNIDNASADCDAAGDSRDDYLQAVQWCNMAAQMIARRGPWPWLKVVRASLTLSDGTYTSNLADDFVHLYVKPWYEGANRRMDEVTLEKIGRLRSGSTNEGMPQCFAMTYDGTNMRHAIHFWPNASGDQTVYYAYYSTIPAITAHATDCDEDTGIFAIPGPLHYILEYGAIAHAERYGQRNWKGGAWQTFETELEKVWIKQQTASPNRRMALQSHWGTRDRLTELHDESDLEVTHT